MTVKNIILKSATLLGKEDLIEHLSGGELDSDLTAEMIKEVDNFITATNMTINALATEFLPVKTIEYVTNYGGRIYLNTLKSQPFEITAVFDATGNKVKFRLDENSIKTSATAVKVEYSYLPPEYTLLETICYKENVLPSRVIAYGVASEISLIEGRFSDAETFRDRFISSVKSFQKVKSKTIKGRKFR